MWRVVPAWSILKKSSGEKLRMYSVWLPMDQGSVLDRLAGAQVRIQRCGFVCGAEIQRECEVELIDVAGANPLVNGFDAVGELGFGEAG